MLVAGVVVALLLLFVRIVPAHPHIVDGDTIEFGNRRWRMAGFDAPEYDQPGGRQASAFLRDQLAGGRSIGIAGGTDIYGRRVIRIITRRGPLAFRMIRAGWAHPEGILGWMIMLYARIRRRGIWKTRGRVISPRVWREMRQRVRYTTVKPARAPKTRLRFDYDPKKGLKLPGGFILP